MDGDWTALRNALVESYDELTRRLTRRLQSAELAREALQDTFIQLERKKNSELAHVDNPFNYLLRIATNVAIDRKRSERRHAAAIDIEQAIHIADDNPDPSQVAEARSDLAALERALETLPPRQRAIFLAAWKQDMTPEAIARKYGLSKRRVYYELESARQACAAVLKKNLGK